MPPFIPKKRRTSTPPPDSPISKPSKKPNLFDTADKPNATTTLQDNKAFLDGLNVSDDESTLSDVSSDEFENVTTPPNPKRQKTIHDIYNEDEIDWEDAIETGAALPTTAGPVLSGDLELILDKSAHNGTLTNPYDKKKGPSKIERQIRLSTHCMHVQFLLFHNLIRNGWACDKEAQHILVSDLPPGVQNAVEIWKVASGIKPANDVQKPKTTHRRGRKTKETAGNERSQRDWGKPAERQEVGVPNMSRGDPLLRLLKTLAAYWKKRFTITAPGLRKQGYKSLSTIEEEIASWRNDDHNAEEHGERILGIEHFRSLARLCEGSRDIGAQLFTALVRGIGIEARLVASLQPAGFGWNKNEEAMIKKKKQTQKMQETWDGRVSDEASVGDDDEDEPVKNKTIPRAKPQGGSKGHPPRKRGRPKGGEDTPIDLVETPDGSDSAKVDGSGQEDDDESVVDITPSTLRKKSNANYDRDMPAPTYWTEVISPVTNEVHPVEPLVLTPAVVANVEHLAQFEPRGAKADKAKQVFAYVIAYSPDGTAKDVTTRYLKRHMWPGRTKGARMPVEKIPVYNHRGKIKRHEEYDWFKTVMSGYRRTHAMRSVVDDLEEARDLKPAKPEKKEGKVGEETLQGYKSSAEFVLERHLRREEALRPGAKPVKSFIAGKGENAKEESVYERKDVEICRTGESWHKEGRAVKPGEQPMKKVPVRAVTMNRKREVEEAERDGGGKLMQGMYARDQTDWIIPPPIENGVIPKNPFGNMDCYVPSMVPKGAVHIPLRSTVRICKRLDIDYAEAVTGFEFGKRMAVPIITGVVVAEEKEHAVIEEWEKDEEERRIKEEGKREKAALATWRKWLMGLRIIQRVKEEYGNDAEAHMKEDMNPFTNQNQAKKASKLQSLEEEPLKPEETVVDVDTGGGFISDDANDLGGGGFRLEASEEGTMAHDETALRIEVDRPLANGHLSPRPRLSMPTPQEDGQKHEIANAVRPNKNKGRMSISKAKRGDGTSLSNAQASKAPVKPGRTRKAPGPGQEVEEALNAPPTEPARAAPRRQPARESSIATKSPYFQHDSDEDEESEDSEESSEAEEEVFEPAAKKRRGRPSGTSQAKRGKMAV
ncbi:MAG: hypothetical protein Q9164_002633 [Protoblastenia rupestris]